jgi:nitrate reductase NapE component
VKIIFVLCLTELQGTETFKAHGAVLLMANCSNHTSGDVIAILTREKVEIITFALHTTGIFQMLNVMLFGALKKHATGLIMLEEEQTIAAFRIKVCHDFKQMMIAVNR